MAADAHGPPSTVSGVVFGQLCGVCGFSRVSSFGGGLGLGVLGVVFSSSFLGGRGGLAQATHARLVRLTPTISFLPPAYPVAHWYKKQEHHMSEQTSSPRLTRKSSFLVKRNKINAHKRVRTN